MGHGLGPAHRDPERIDLNDNIIMYWRPRQALAAGQRDHDRLPAGLVLAAAGPPGRSRSPPGFARAAAPRRRRRRFVVEFAGDRLADAGVVASTRANITTQPGAIHNVRIWPYPERKLMRVGFEVDPGTDNLCELRLVLQSGGQPVSETWLDRWTW